MYQSWKGFEMKEIVWACELAFLRSYIDQVLEYHGKEIEDFRSEFNIQRKKSKIYSITSKKEGIISITGILSRSGPSIIEQMLGFGGTSYNDIVEAAQELKASNVDTVRLIMDTPGGEVTGADETYMAIKDLAQSKNVVAENHGMLASAGYWIASAADSIVSTSPVNQTGSIGVIATLVDTSEAEERQGIKKIQMVSTNAPNKLDGVDNNKIESVKEILDAIERVFVSRVAEGRGVSEKTVTSQFGRGGLMIAQDPNEKSKDAISVGMIDGLTALSLDAACGGKKSRKRAEIGDIEIAEEIEQIEKAQTERIKEMKLKDVLVEHPEIQGEIDALVIEANKDGRKSALAKNEFLVQILSGKDYPDSVKKVGYDVLKGVQTMETFSSVMAVYDAMKEEKNITVAVDETEGLGDTKAEIVKETSQDGIVRSVEDIDVAVSGIKNAMGIN